MDGTSSLALHGCLFWVGNELVFLRKAEKLNKTHFHSTLEQGRSISKKIVLGRCRAGIMNSQVVRAGMWNVGKAAQVFPSLI